MSPNRPTLGAILREASSGIWPEFLAIWVRLRPWVISSIVVTGVALAVLLGSGDNRESPIFVFAVFALLGGLGLALILAVLMIGGPVLTWLRDIAELRRDHTGKK
jgi:hypothetical protein